MGGGRPRMLTLAAEEADIAPIVARLAGTWTVPLMQLIGVDAGGTFTDTVVVTRSGQMAIGKALSTPPDPAEGVIASLADAAGRLGMTTCTIWSARLTCSPTGPLSASTPS